MARLHRPHSLLAPGLDGFLPWATTRGAFLGFSAVLELGVEVEEGRTEEVAAERWALSWAWTALCTGSGGDLWELWLFLLGAVRRFTCFTAACKWGSRWASENPVKKQNKKPVSEMKYSSTSFYHAPLKGRSRWTSQNHVRNEIQLHIIL